MELEQVFFNKTLTPQNVSSESTQNTNFANGDAMFATFFLLALLTTPVNYACQLCLSIIVNYQAQKKLSIIEICLSITVRASPGDIASEV
jgi:hypothetical protein